METRSTLRRGTLAVDARKSVAQIVPMGPDVLLRHRHRKRYAPVDSKSRTDVASQVSDLVLALYEWKAQHQYLGRYSVDKLVLFDQYCQRASRFRVAAVVCLTPLPVIAITLAFQAVPLVDPGLGPARNWRQFVGSSVSHCILSLCLLGPFKQALRISDSIYPLKRIFFIAAFAAIANELIWMIPAFCWQYPVPFRELLASLTWSPLLTIGHVMLARRVVTSKWGRMKKYLPLLTANFTLFFAFLGLALVFSRFPPSVQLTWILLFPLFKFAIKKWLWQFSRRLDDISTDVTICLVEIYGGLYQSVCMQMLQSLPAALLLMVMDLIHAAVDIWMYSNHGFIVDGTSTISTAVKIVESSLFPAVGEARCQTQIESPESQPPRPLVRRFTWSGKSSNSRRGSGRLLQTATVEPSRCSSLSQANTRRRGSFSSEYVARSPNSVFTPPADYQRRSSSRRQILNLSRHSVIQSRDQTSRTSVASTCGDESSRFSSVHALGKHKSSVQIDSVLISRKDQARILEQTLQLLFSCEVLIFIEYVEVIIPLVYTVIATASWFLPNAKYNLILCTMSRTQVVSGLTYTLGYAALELLSFSSMTVLMKRKFGVSTLYQLAFVLESYALTVQGKLVGSFIVIANLATVHQGVDMLALIGQGAGSHSCRVGSV